MVLHRHCCGIWQVPTSVTAIDFICSFSLILFFFLTLSFLLVLLLTFWYYYIPVLYSVLIPALYSGPSTKCFSFLLIPLLT